jgi:asparagine synthase (glutamine-hydrolysing)
VDPEAGLAFAHRRLSIIDLSDAGAQPMTSPSGRYVLNYNGEVYNFPNLRRGLEEGGAGFRGHCDTEVLLTGIDTWGLEETLRGRAAAFCSPRNCGRCGPTRIFPASSIAPRSVNCCA